MRTVRIAVNDEKNTAINEVMLQRKTDQIATVRSQLSLRLLLS